MVEYDYVEITSLQLIRPPTEIYPLPSIEELLAAMSGGKYFSKLDLQNAYLQLPLDSASKQYMAINTHHGLFQYNRLPFSVASAPHGDAPTGPRGC